MARIFGLIWIITLLINTNVYSSQIIKIRSIAVVDGNYLRLKEIAMPEGDIENWDKVKDIPLIDLQGFPTSRIISRETLDEVLAHRLPLSIFSMCEVPEKIRIIRGQYLLDKSKLMSIIMEFVYKNTPYITGEKRVRDISTPEYMVLKKGEKLYIHPINNKVLPGYNSISFVVVKNRQKVRSRPGKFFLDVWKEVPCASRPLNIGELLTPDKVTFVKKNLAYLPKDIWNGRTGPWRIKIPIGRLQVISLNKLEPMPTIQKGQKIKLIFEGHNVYLSVIAQSLEDGKIGDIIKVVNLQSRRVVYAKVINKDTARVE